MSGTYLYCVVPGAAPDPPPSLAGVAGTPVRRIDTGSIGAWVSTVPALPEARTPAERRALAVAHDRVVAAALAGGVTPVPARAGQRFADDDECLARLASQRETHEASLRRVEGLVEMTASLFLDAPATRPHFAPNVGGPGTQHLARLRERHGAIEQVHQRALAAATAMGRLLGPIVRDTAVRARLSPRTGVAVSHLLARDDAVEYRLRLADQALEGFATRMTVTGPTAPYSFVGDVSPNRS